MSTAGSKHLTLPSTGLSRHTSDSIAYRDRDLVNDILGQKSFVEVFFYQTMDRDPSPGEVDVINSILIALMEHGLTPSVIAARLVYSSSPENIQAGVSAGLLAVASRFVGTMEDCARILDRVVASDDPQLALEVAQSYRERKEPVPGFGHHLHRPDDPRVARLLELAASRGITGKYVAALHELAARVDEVAGRHITINTTGAVAALLGDIGVPAGLMRGFAIVSRAAGLVAHIAEEQHHPTDRFIWNLVDTTIPFRENGDQIAHGAERDSA
ncbi:citryl-CoA lyase [Streptomyces acidicola]|uniref:citryl-CoA lyase n=1 Tax=Streptomyces acidicola TaxID=2596892 RepID=UPI00380A5771